MSRRDSLDDASQDPGPGSEADWFPLDDSQHRAQVAALLERLGVGSRVIDLGCGSGRVAVPLAASGVDVTAVDRDPSALGALLQASPGVRTIEGDFCAVVEGLRSRGEAFEAALCLGNTLLEVHDPIDALGLFRSVASLLAPGGSLLIDDFPAEIWAEVAEGNWRAGLAEDVEIGERVQLVWGECDPVIALRHGGDVDEDAWEFSSRDRRVRLYSLGELELLAHSAGLGAPERQQGAHLIVFRPAG